ncbi:MAG TPA: hypothetical protein VLM89_05950 [Phycisphaerae bacterium]|nr:hypothetical protein [Phycisphaerae bacterium]
MHRNPENVSTKQERMATLARQSPEMGFTSPAYLMGLEWLGEAYRTVDAHVGNRLRMWLNAKHKVRGVGKKHFIDAAESCRLGLARLQGRTGSLPWANA